MPLKIKYGVTDENNDFDGLLATLLGSILFGCLLTGWQFFFRNASFDFSSFGAGVAAIAGAGGMGYGAKRLGEKYGSKPDPSVPEG